MATNDAIVERLRQWSSCDVSDGLSKLDHAHGGFLEGIKMYSPEFLNGDTKIVGPVFTVKFAPKNDSSAPKLKGNYVDQVPRNAVVFISQPTPHINACYGGLMSEGLKFLGAAGVVIDGAFRDLQEHRDLGLPLFARTNGTTAGGAVCFASEVGVSVPLQSSIQQAVINAGDYLIADKDGVVVLPASLAEKVLEIIPTVAEADQKCAEAIRSGMSVEDAFAKFRSKK